MTIVNSTLAGNGAGSGGGLFVNANATGTVTNSILADNGGGNCAGSVTDGGHNLDDGASCGFSALNASLSNTDAELSEHCPRKPGQ